MKVRPATAAFHIAAGASAVLFLATLTLWAAAGLGGSRVLTRVVQDYDGATFAQRAHVLRFEGRLVLYRWSYATRRIPGEARPLRTWRWSRDLGSLFPGTSSWEQQGFLYEKWETPWGHGFRAAVPWWTLFVATGLLPFIALARLRAARARRRPGNGPPAAGEAEPAQGPAPGSESH